MLDDIYMSFRTSIARIKPVIQSGDYCPFCDRQSIYKEGKVIREEHPFMLVENKYQTLEDAYQMVLIESETCDYDLSNYNKKHLHRLLDFVLRCWKEIEESGEYSSVVLFKNYGVHSGGSVYHPHMQIVGLNTINYLKHVYPHHFVGLVIDEKEGVQFNLSRYPRSGFTEFNIVLKDLLALPHMADYIQIAVHFLLNHMNKKYQSYNIFFYRLDDGIAAKLILRAPGSPYLMGYSIVQIPDNQQEIIERVKALYFSNAFGEHTT